ncbi:MAG: hypothetical protein WD492_10120 [Alkalispirochaeta sp.]
MSIDYLDPFRPTNPVEQPRERRETERPREVDRDHEPVREEPSRDDEVRNEDAQRGNSVDQYA